jgi:hypothetical protein
MADNPPFSECPLDPDSSDRACVLATTLRVATSERDSAHDDAKTRPGMSSGWARGNLAAKDKRRRSVILLPS